MQECERNQIVYSETLKWERDRVVEILFRKGWGNDFSDCIILSLQPPPLP